MALPCLIMSMPVARTASGFPFTLVAAWIDDRAAARLGGFELTTVDVAGAGATTRTGRRS